MSATGNVLMVLALGAVFSVLAIGIVSMLKGGEFNRKYGNRLMRARVLLQGLALLLLVLLFLAQ